MGCTSGGKTAAQFMPVASRIKTDYLLYSKPKGTLKGYA